MNNKKVANELVKIAKELESNSSSRQWMRGVEDYIMGDDIEAVKSIYNFVALRLNKEGIRVNPKKLKTTYWED